MPRAVVWTGIEAASSGLLSLASAFIVARIIGPEELGIGAAAVALHMLLWVLVNASFADALVQRAQLDDRVMSSAFWSSIGVGCAAMLIEIAAGLPLAAVLHDSRLPAMSCLLALALPLVGAGGIAQGQLTRARDYRGLAARAIIGQGCGTATGIAAALAGAGAWAMVVQQCVTSVLGAATLLLAAGWRPCAVWEVRPVRELLRTGLPIALSTLTQHGRYRLFALLVGGTAGAAALGYMHMAFRLIDTVRELCFTAQWRVMLPALAERQHDQRLLRAEVDRLLGLSSWLMLPLAGGMAVSVPLLIESVLGSAWAPCGHAVAPLCAVMALLALMFPSGAALVARGRAQHTLFANMIGTAATLGLAIVVRPEGPGSAALVWLGGALIAAPYALRMNGKAVGTGPLRPLLAGLPSLGVTGLALLAAAMLPGLSGGALAAARLLTGLAVCVAGFAFLHRKTRRLFPSGAAQAMVGPVLSRVPAHEAD
jgi:PST family polysaccharide transporter